MVKLNFIVEGQTEETFVKSVLVPHLSELSVYPAVRCVATRSDGPGFFRGGISGYERAKRDIVAWMRQERHPDTRFTTMFDFYALPSNFPGYECAQRVNDCYERVAILERAIKADINDRRFLPYFQLHEFEALLFSDPSKLAVRYYDQVDNIEKLERTASEFESPELIDQGANTAPSKRIIAAIPEYRKVASGASVAEAIGLPTLRTKCRHFGDWITKLEGLNSKCVV